VDERVRAAGQESPPHERVTADGVQC
jgi:hypothetical protein